MWGRCYPPSCAPAAKVSVRGGPAGGWRCNEGAGIFASPVSLSRWGGCVKFIDECFGFAIMPSMQQIRRATRNNNLTVSMSVETHVVGLHGLAGK